MAPPKNTIELVANLRRLFANTHFVAEKIDAYIIPGEDAHQSEYIAESDGRIAFLSGFNGSRALAAVSHSSAALWTDGRYFIQARAQMDDGWTLMREGVAGTPTPESWLIDQVGVGGVVGVDPRLISADTFRKMRKQFKSADVSLKPVPINLVDILWSNERPAVPSQPLIVLPIELTGKSWQQKIDEIRRQLIAKRAHLLLLTALDEIAWTFNLRGSDIQYNPVFFAYAVIGRDFVSLFVDEEKVTANVKSHLNVDRKHGDTMFVQMYPYQSVGDYLAKYATAVDGKVWLSGESTNFALFSIVEKSKRFEESSPILMMKTVKNATELQGMRNAHIRDAAAHCEFLYWLEKAMRSGEPVTEISAAAQFDHFRSSQTFYVSPSFGTISATGENAAQPHYKSTTESNTRLRTDRIYLVDSGAQYRDGTTDVTRTVCFDEPSAHERKCFTLVLKGHIQLSKQRFPEQANGMRLDSLARMALWNAGLDFRHGTGHGVGHFLNVHEGPAGIGYRSISYAKEGIVENMVLTIEPGYYEEGHFGVRIENVCIVVSADIDNQFGRFLTFEPITLVPIQKKFLDPSLLTADEMTWLNQYHEDCCVKVGPLLETQGKSDVLKWLEEQCQPLG